MEVQDYYEKEYAEKEPSFVALMDKALRSIRNLWSVKATEVPVFNEVVLNFPRDEKFLFMVDCVKKISFQQKLNNSGNTQHWEEINLRNAFLSHLFRMKLEFTPEQIMALVELFEKEKYNDWTGLMGWPVNLFVTQLERRYKKEELPATVEAALLRMKEILQTENQYQEKERQRVIAKISALLFKHQSGDQPEAALPYKLEGKDPLSTYANPQLEALPAGDRNSWYKILSLAQKASGSRPSARFLADSKELYKELGPDKFKKLVTGWFDFVISLKEREEQHLSEFNGQTYQFSTYEFVSAPNLDLLKGLVWICAHFHDQHTLTLIAALAERAFRKIPGKGPAAAALGNACLYTLYRSKGLDGIGHLSRLKLRIRQNSTQNLIEKYLEEAASEQGISVYEIEEISVESYGLQEGVRIYELEGYKAELKITGIGKTATVWYKPDGSPQKSVPVIVKEKQGARLKKIKDTSRSIEMTLTAQRDRIDRMFKTGRILEWPKFLEYYLDHGLVSFIARSLIWNFETDGVKQEVILIDGEWLNDKQEKIVPGTTTLVSLWHPAYSSVAEIKAWREFLIERKIVQPLKQAFREVYLLTDAELNTRVYSNRMAAHLLRQHQFSTLAKLRGWKYSLMGAYDDGRYNEAAEIRLPDYNLQAEFWVNEVNAEHAYNDTGIWNYVATDQVRFVDLDTNQPVELIHIPPVVFSEIMRDVDLFVGVASVGNDPAWRDSGGIPAYRDYWNTYSFGELTEIAKTRKEILERLVPRLKIASIAEIRDKFLVVQGKLRTYKIHIGSTNILMEPNDQYLCIVPDRSQKNSMENVFLPFEGDTGLSVIISKAFLLAEDDKIADSTITSQINRA